MSLRVDIPGMQKVVAEEPRRPGMLEGQENQEKRKSWLGDDVNECESPEPVWECQGWACRESGHGHELEREAQEAEVVSIALRFVVSGQEVYAFVDLARILQGLPAQLGNCRGWQHDAGVGTHIGARPTSNFEDFGDECLVRRRSSHISASYADESSVQSRYASHVARTAP
jgi:hypothetical protein